MTELTSALILVVTEKSSQAERLRELLSGAPYRILQVADLQTAEARIAGGGVDLMVMRLAPDPLKTRISESIAFVRKRSAELPIIIWCDGVSKDLALMHRPSISGVLYVQDSNLVATVQTLMARQRTPQAITRREGSASIVSLQGAKGGVGTSTVALNLAVLLTGQGKTILAEMPPGPGKLASQFRLRRKIRTIADLASSTDVITTASFEDCLWPCHAIPGLSILFGPCSFACDLDWAARIGEILSIAANCADYLVIDLPNCFSAANRAALLVTDYLLLVLERDALSLQAGKLMLGAIESENPLPRSTAAVVVSRVPLAAPVDLPEVEHELNVPVLAAAPPDPDLCLRAYQAQTAVAALDPDSLLAASYAGMAQTLSTALRARRPRSADSTARLSV